eukprot:16585-Pelagomonas_calceolata.AAC.1
MVRAHQPPTIQHQHHPPPAEGAAAPGHNTGGAVKRGQAASVDRDSHARARKINQAMQATWGPLRNYGTFGGYIGPSSNGNGPPVISD